MLRSPNQALRTASATPSDAKSSGRKRSSIRKALTLAAVAAGITAGSVLGVAPAHADTQTAGDCTMSAKLLVERYASSAPAKGGSFRFEGVGDVRCLTPKGTISAELLLKRNGETVRRTSGTWTNTRSLGGESMWTSPYQGSSLLGGQSGCGMFQSVLNVSISGMAPVSVTSGAPVAACT